MKKKMQGSVNFRIYKFPWFAQFFFFYIFGKKIPLQGQHTFSWLPYIEGLEFITLVWVLYIAVLGWGKKKTKTNANMKGSRGAIFKRFAAIPQRPPLQSFRSKTSDKRESSLLSPFPGINPFINMSRHTQISRIFQAS